MIKNQLFYVLKLNSDFLRYKNYNLNCSVEEMRANKWLVSLADSQALRTIRMVRYERNPDAIRYDPDKLSELLKMRKRLYHMQYTPDNCKQIHQITKEIDDMLVIPEYLVIKIDKKKQYVDIIKHGLIINGKKYVRFLAGAGHVRNNTVVFIAEDFELDVKKRLQNNWNPTTKITENKFNAYMALSASASWQIDDDDHLLTPKVILINDCETTMRKKVDWVEDAQVFNPNIPIELQNKKHIVTQDKELEFNFFDGGGLIDISTARRWAEKLKLDYVPSTFVIRNIYIKGCLFVVDFHKFAQDVAHQQYIVDLYGNVQNVGESDIILTKSMFKLWNAYNSMEEYQQYCWDNHNYWGVTRVAPKADDDYVTTNYQFLQVLNMNDDDVHNVCDTTINWLKGVSGLDPVYSMLFLMGNLANNDDPDFVYNSISDNVVKALAINQEMIKDDYIRQKLITAINKKITEAYIGKLIVQGCFSVMIPDPYALMEWAFANGDINKVRGLLNEHEHYSNYWNSRNVSEAIACRSPLTWRSEVNKLNLKNNDQTSEWYQYLNSGIIYNIWGTDCMLHAD